MQKLVVGDVWFLVGLSFAGNGVHGGAKGSFWVLQFQLWNSLLIYAFELKNVLSLAHAYHRSIVLSYH